MGKIKRAIILAAGKGTRMYPITEHTPKPLIKVRGVPMIETIINALNKNGIYEIYVVVGYLNEQFKYLESKYSCLKLIENPYYDKCNNISSLYVVKDKIDDTFIIDGDQVINNSEILNPEFTLSGYNAIWSEGFTNEWLMTADENMIVKSCSRTGGEKGWQLFGVSRWSKSDGLKLKEFLETEFIKNNKRDIYWDDIAMFLHFDSFKIKVYEMNYNDIIELDSIEELKQYE